LLDSKLHQFLLSLETPLETQVFVRAGRNEVGGACFITTRQIVELPVRYHLGVRISLNVTQQELSAWARTKCREQQNEVREIYYKRASVSIKKNALKPAGDFETPPPGMPACRHLSFQLTGWHSRMNNCTADSTADSSWPRLLPASTFSAKTLPDKLSKHQNRTPRLP